jgi:hypothetical protein
MGRAAESQRFRELFDRAVDAGCTAAAAAQCQPMVVGTPRNMMGSLTGGDDGGFREDRPVYVVNDGPCGIGYVMLYAERGGESRRFVNYLRKRELARHSDYHGGYLIFCRGRDGRGLQTQSYARNSAYVQAFAEVLRGEVEGLRAFGQTRLD